MEDEQGETADEGAELKKTDNKKVSAPDIKAGRLKRAGKAMYRVAKKAAKYAFITTIATAPIRGTPGNKVIRFAQNAGVLPAVGNLESQEYPYLGTTRDSFADGIDAAPLPEIPLKSSRVGNYVIEPDGQDLPSYFLHGEPVSAAINIRRMNTTILHAQGVASSYHHTLKKILGKEPNVKLIDGFASEGFIFNGPHVDLFHHNKTIINKSVGGGALEPDCDVSDYKAWIFFSAGNLGSSADHQDFQPQLGGVANHGPRSVMVGALHGSTHCGPVFYALSSSSGEIKSHAARLSFLPSDARSDAYESTYRGWGATSNASPAAAARFSALMERYGNYLSEEQIFTAFCHATGQETKARLPVELQKAKTENNMNDIKRINEEIAAYDSTNTPGRAGARHVYDPCMYGFGEITQAALARADELCQQMVIYTAYHPEAVSRPATFKATIGLSERAVRNPEGLYSYKLHVPEVNLNNIRLEGSLVTRSLKDEKIFLVANGIKIRVPVGHTSLSKQQEWVSDGEESKFIGSSRGFTGAGPVGEIEILSTVPLKDDFCLTCHNTLSRGDAVSRLDSLRADIDHLQLNSKKVMSLWTAQAIDPQKVDPQGVTVNLRLYPANVSERDIQQDQQHRHDRDDSQPKPKNSEHMAAYWRRREEELPPPGNYIAKT
jgi:hypothetical protein